RASAVDLLDEPRGDDEGRRQQREVVEHAARADTDRAGIAGGQVPSPRSERRGEPAPASGGGERVRRGQNETGEEHDQLEAVAPGRAEQAAGGEVDDDHDSAEEGALPARQTGDHLEDDGDGDELGRKESDRSGPEDEGDRAPHGAAVPVLEVVTERV